MIIDIDNVLEQMYEILCKDSVVSCKIKFISFRDANKFYNTITDEFLFPIDHVVIVGDIVIVILTQDDKDGFDDLITHFDFSEISII